MSNLTIHHHETFTPATDTGTPDPHQDVFSKNTFGFWMYLMTDCLLFATLFCTYAVLRTSTFGGPSSKELFELPTALAETLILLVSSFTCGMAMLSALQNSKGKIIGWLAITFLLGAAFLTLELNEFIHFVREGNSWTRSAFLSSFFTLVSMHGLHITVGLFWLIVMLLQVYFMGVTTTTFRRLAIFSLFWHFLDLVWIFIFTFVYLMGVI